MKTSEIKPFWMDTEAWERKWVEKYPPMSDMNMAENVKEGIPKLTHVEKGSLLGDYTLKDKLYIYHFYLKERKVIYDAAQEEMSRISETAAKKDVLYLQNKVAVEANKSLEAHPWPKAFRELLHKIFSEHFKYQLFKVTYYPEVDSWSVIMPEPNGVVRLSSTMLEAVFSKLALALYGLN